MTATSELVISPTLNSRSYLNHFTQPDTIVPDLNNPQAWDRYAYAFNNPVRYNDPSGHCPICLTGVIGGAIGGIVGAVGYTAYVAATGKKFNSTHFWIATGGGAAAGALIGTGVGFAAGVGVAEATTAAVGVGEAANVACGGDMCASETQQLVQTAQKALPVVENAATQLGDDAVQVAQQTIDDLIANSQQVSSPAGEAIYRTPENAVSALSRFSNVIDTQIVNADKALNRFWANNPLGGTSQLRLTSSPPSTPVLELFNIPGYLKNIKFHFIGD